MEKKQLITPELINVFIASFRKKIVNEDANVTVADLELGGTRASVKVDNIRVGKIISYFSNIDFSQETYLYFFPDYSYFEYCKMDSVQQFLDYSSQFLTNTLVTLKVIDEKTEVPMKKILDYRFDLQFEERSFIGHFCSYETSFNESGRIIYRLVKENDYFKMVDDFKYSINNNTIDIFDIKKYSNLFSILLVKDDDMYRLSDDACTSIYSFEFSESESLPDIQYFADIIFYYAVMIETGMDCPPFEEYLSNLNDYKKIVEMSII